MKQTRLTGAFSLPSVVDCYTGKVLDHTSPSLRSPPRLLFFARTPCRIANSSVASVATSNAPVILAPDGRGDVEGSGAGSQGGATDANTYGVVGGADEHCLVGVCADSFHFGVFE